MLWCVDTSAWIDAVRFYNPASALFEGFWDYTFSLASCWEVVQR